MELHELIKTKGNRTKSKRVGRGVGSGKGAHTVGKGQKGQKSRGSRKVKPWFEGGQLPLVKRLPQMGGFRNPTRKEFSVLNVSFFNRFDEGTKITIEFLKKDGLKNIKENGVKILGKGNLEKKLNFEGFLYSKSAIKQIEKHGGSVK